MSHEFPKEIRAWQTSDGQSHNTRAKADIREAELTLEAFWMAHGGRDMDAHDMTKICVERAEELFSILKRIAPNLG
jgi:hypothetical protein